jgi:hypothetical protein
MNGQGKESRRVFQIRNGSRIGNHSIAKPDEHADLGRLQPRIAGGNGPRQTLIIQFRLRPQVLLQDRQSPFSFHQDKIERIGRNIKRSRVRMGSTPPINRRPFTSPNVPNVGRSMPMRSDSCEEAAGGGPIARARKLRRNATEPEMRL